MINPLGLMKTVIDRQLDATIGENYINSNRTAFGSPAQLQDIGASKFESSYVSRDQSDKWFFMGISKWGASNNIVSE